MVSVLDSLKLLLPKHILLLLKIWSNRAPNVYWKKFQRVVYHRNLFIKKTKKLYSIIKALKGCGWMDSSSPDWRTNGLPCKKNGQTSYKIPNLTFAEFHFLQEIKHGFISLNCKDVPVIGSGCVKIKTGQSLRNEYKTLGKVLFAILYCCWTFRSNSRTDWP